MEPNGTTVGAVFEKADLTGTNIQTVDGAMIRCSGAIMAKVHAQAASLIGAVLSRCDLRGAILHGTDLSNADLSSCDLREADILDATLIAADLRNADMRGARQKRPYLTRAKLDGLKYEVR
jgi:uncharacterized protein YjbI with pentapeptide repeats